jgi:hypothetical protein
MNKYEIIMRRYSLSDFCAVMLVKFKGRGSFLGK